MKALLLALLSTVSLNAAAADLCGTTFACGTFSVKTTVDSEEYTITIKIAAQGEKALAVDYTSGLSSEANPVTHVFTTTFDTDGSYRMVQADGTLFAVGICKELLCGMAMRQFPGDGELYANSSMIRFKDGKLEMLQGWGTPTKFQSNLLVLEPK